MLTKKPPSTFTLEVKRLVAAILPGTVRTYKEIATAAGKPNAARAVALIMSQNYDPLVPCHRVIRSDGSLGGYNRGGEVAKREILKNEGWAD